MWLKFRSNLFTYILCKEWRLTTSILNVGNVRGTKTLVCVIHSGLLGSITNGLQSNKLQWFCLNIRPINTSPRCAALWGGRLICTFRLLEREYSSFKAGYHTIVSGSWHVVREVVLLNLTFIVLRWVARILFQTLHSLWQTNKLLIEIVYKQIFSYYRTQSMLFCSLL